jgi:hypothetical protein
MSRDLPEDPFSWGSDEAVVWEAGAYGEEEEEYYA